MRRSRLAPRAPSPPSLPLEGLRRVALVGHRYSDPDAYCSAYGLMGLLRAINGSCEAYFCSPGGFNAATKRIMALYPMPVALEPDFTKLEAIVLVDTGHASLLTDWREAIANSKALKLAIDHHPLDDTIRAMVAEYFVEPEASSTCELVVKLYEAKGIGLEPDAAQVLLIGLLYDSQNLMMASCDTLEVCSLLCRAGASLKEARKHLLMEREISEIIARLKGAKRSIAYRAGDWFIVESQVGSHHASVAKALLGLGADLSFSLGEVDGEVRCSLRSTERFHEESGLHLGLKVAKPVAKALKGEGGGHPTAASLTTKAPLEKVREALRRRISEAIKCSLEPLEE